MDNKVIKIALSAVYHVMDELKIKRKDDFLMQIRKAFETDDETTELESRD